MTNDSTNSAKDPEAEKAEYPQLPGVQQTDLQLRLESKGFRQIFSQE